jgi:small GTP-binding protein
MSFELKIGLLGDPATGKTSLGKRYTDASFSADYKATVGVDIYFKEIHNKDGVVKLVIWDMSGNKSFAIIRSSYLQGLNGVLIIFDTSRSFSVDGNILPWVFELLQIQIRKNLPLAVIGNKSDISIFEKINDEEIINELKSIYKFERIKYFTTSALTGENVEAAFSWLIENIIKI